MKKLITGIVRIGNWMTGLSNRTRLAIVLTGLAVLLGCSSYKLIHSAQALNQPLPAVDPNQLIEPMQEIFQQTRLRYTTLTPDKDAARLDSLAKVYMNKNLQQP